MEGRYAECEKIALVCDNLNTHTKGAFYEVFEPTRARELVRRIEFCYTPKQLAEHRGERTQFDDAPMPARAPHQAAARRSVGVVGRSTIQRGVDWQMKVDDARGKLKSAKIMM